MAEASVRCLCDGHLDREHAPALAMEGSLQCCPLAAGVMLHVAAALASQVAAGKAQAGYCQVLLHIVLLGLYKLIWLVMCLVVQGSGDCGV
jgi:hypothetical protein